MDPDATHFRYSPITVWKLRIAILGGLSVAGVAAYVALFDPPHNEAQWPLVLGNLVGALAASIFVMRCHHLVSSTYAIDSCWVSQLRQQVVVRQLAWGQIHELRFRRLAGQLVLTTTDSEASIRVEEQLLKLANSCSWPRSSPASRHVLYGGERIGIRAVVNRCQRQPYSWCHPLMWTEMEFRHRLVE